MLLVPSCSSKVRYFESVKRESRVLVSRIYDFYGKYAFESLMSGRGGFCTK